jgi:hypothetical protein
MNSVRDRGYHGTNTDASALSTAASTESLREKERVGTRGGEVAAGRERGASGEKG